jgi:small subunit ribosomal protein S6
MSQFKYDLIYIVDPNSTSEEVASVATKVEQLTAAASGSVVKKEEWGRRRLAYRIGRHREGIYAFFQITVDTKTIDEITRNLRLIEKVVKFMVVKEEISHRKPKPPRKKTSRPAGEGVNRPTFRPPNRPSAHTSSTPSAAPSAPSAPPAAPPVAPPAAPSAPESAPSADAPAS